MQIRVNKGRVEVKATKLELKRLSDAHVFAASIPRGIGLDKEMEAAEKALWNLIMAIEKPADTPKE